MADKNTKNNLQQLGEGWSLSQWISEEFNEKVQHIRQNWNNIAKFSFDALSSKRREICTKES